MLKYVKIYIDFFWFKVLAYLFFFILASIAMITYKKVCEFGGSLIKPTSLKTIFDDFIPFNIYFIYPYVLCMGIILFIGIFLSSYKRITSLQILAFYLSIIVMYLFCYIIYIIFPTTAKDVMITTYNPNILNIEKYKIINRLYSISTPLGDFPSLHVALMVFISLFLYKNWRVFFWILLPITFPGAVGTILLKFHVFIGFIGGAAMGVFVYFIIYEKLIFNKMNNLINKI